MMRFLNARYWLYSTSLIGEGAVRLEVKFIRDFGDQDLLIVQQVL